jgi:alkylation response protein AidB-like acyl-CoA dehydrogenase
MDFELSEPHKMFQKAIRDFAGKEIKPLVKEAEETETFPVQLFPKMGELGYLCPGYPEEYGGGGLGKIGDCILAEEVARICPGIASGILVQGGLATYTILAHGSRAQKQKYLVSAIKGQKIVAFGLMGPNAGSDAGAIETTARREGDNYIRGCPKTRGIFPKVGNCC